jgi:hypothetical protein
VGVLHRLQKIGVILVASADADVFVGEEAEPNLEAALAVVELLRAPNKTDYVKKRRQISEAAR